MSLPSDLVDIINAIAEPDEYRHRSAVNQAIHDYAVSRLPAPIEGYERTINSIDYDNATATYTDVSLADKKKERINARMQSLTTAGLVPVASVYRTSLRAITGDPAAETNRGIDEKSIFAYFFGIAAQRPLTAEELRVKDVLQNGFVALRDWNGTNEVWTLFDDLGGMIP